MTAGLWVTLSGNAAVLTAAILGYLSTRRRVGKVHVLAEKTEKLVNNQLDRQLLYNQQMAAKLTERGIDVPEQDPPS